MDDQKKDMMHDDVKVYDICESQNKNVGVLPQMVGENGAPIANDQDSMTVGPRGPMVLQDVWFLEKLAHFDREVIPERRMHAKGSGAFGKFVCTQELSDLTYAAPFREVGKETDIFIRFSTVAGERGAADAERDIRGFAIKFYTEDGNWDLVGNNTPVFFFNDPLRFPDLNHAVKRDPRTNMRSANNNWDFWTGLPEALHQITITMSDRGLPKTYRHMDGFSSHAYSMINKEGKRVYVKYHFKTQQGIANLTDQEAAELVGQDRESHQRDLYYAIEKGDYPRWTAYIQVMTEEQAQKMETNPFDLTKVWYHGDYPLREIGWFELNKNPDNYFAEVEQAAFNPANIIPGLGFSPDRMLQGRLFSYGDAQRYRLGVNHNLIPVNYPKNAKNFHPFHRDGLMRTDGNMGSELHYRPNSYGNWKETPETSQPVEQVYGDIDRWNRRKDDDDYYTQPGKLFRIMSKEQQQLLFDNTAGAMGDAEEFIKMRHIEHCFYADHDYGHGVAKALCLEDKVDWELFENKEKKGIKGAEGDMHQITVDGMHRDRVFTDFKM